MSNNDDYADLTAIKGIGPARQQWLRTTLGVRTYNDLAVLSADDIEARLKAEGQVASRNEIERWIVQAQELASADLLSQMESVGTEAGGKVAFPAKEGEWKPFASFVVEFQAWQNAGQAEEQRTKVHYMEGDIEETWSGLVSERLCQWMLDQLGEKAQLGETAEQQRPDAVKQAEPETMEISQIRIYRPPHTESPIAIAKADQPFPSSIKGEEPFACEVSFALTRPVAAEVAEMPVTYRVQFYASNRSTGARAHLGDTGPDALVEGELAYTARLPSVTLSPGSYRLQVVVTLQGAHVIPGHLEVPLLQVV